jgi:hypothetical protein
MDCRGLGRDKILLFSTYFIAVLGPAKPMQWVLVAFSWGVKAAGREAYRSPGINAEVKNTRIYTSTVPYAGCFKKSFTALEAYMNLFRGHLQRCHNVAEHIKLYLG